MLPCEYPTRGLFGVPHYCILNGILYRIPEMPYSQIPCIISNASTTLKYNVYNSILYVQGCRLVKISVIFIFSLILKEHNCLDGMSTGLQIISLFLLLLWFC